MRARLAHAVAATDRCAEARPEPRGRITRAGGSPSRSRHIRFPSAPREDDDGRVPGSLRASVASWSSRAQTLRSASEDRTVKGVVDSRALSVDRRRRVGPELNGPEFPSRDEEDLRDPSATLASLGSPREGARPRGARTAAPARCARTTRSGPPSGSPGRRSCFESSRACDSSGTFPVLVAGDRAALLLERRATPEECDHLAAELAMLPDIQNGDASDLGSYFVAIKMTSGEGGTDERGPCPTRDAPMIDRLTNNCTFATIIGTTRPIAASKDDVVIGHPHLVGNDKVNINTVATLLKRPSRSYSCIARNTPPRVTRSHATTIYSFLPGWLCRAFCSPAVGEA